MFIPNKKVLKKTNKKRRFYKKLVWNANDHISPGDLLFTVKARELQDDGTLSHYHEIGQIVQGDAEWTESLWGDERLFFSHSFMPNDIRDFRAEMNSGPNGEEKRERMRNFNELLDEMPRFDFDKYDVPFDIDEVEFVPQEVTEQ